MKAVRRSPSPRRARATPRREDDRARADDGCVPRRPRRTVRAARTAADVVVASLFVNPAQFDDARDLNGYPRDETRDADIAREAGVDYLFAPAAAEVYPPASRPGSRSRARRRARGAPPGHFRAVATVCLKLFNIVRPQLAFSARRTRSRSRWCGGWCAT